MRGSRCGFSVVGTRCTVASVGGGWGSLARVTADATLDVVGIGNALVDVISNESDEFIEAHGLVKSAMTLVDDARAEELYAAMGPGIELSGGSAANTIAGVASFGGRAAYMGRVFDDQLGAVFAHDLRAQGVLFENKPATEGPPTGRCLIVVTPDAHRTMNTCLGASAFFGPDDVDPEMVRSAQDVPRGLPVRPARVHGGLLVRLRPRARTGARWPSLSDLFCVERHRDEFLPLVLTGQSVRQRAEACALWAATRAPPSSARQCGSCITMSRRARGGLRPRHLGSGRATEVVDHRGGGLSGRASDATPKAAAARCGRLSSRGRRGHQPHGARPSAAIVAARLNSAGVLPEAIFGITAPTGPGC